MSPRKRRRKRRRRETRKRQISELQSQLANAAMLLMAERALSTRLADELARTRRLLGSRLN